MLKSFEPSILLPVHCDDLKRLGAAFDGGYIVPMEAVRNADYLISFGVAFDWKFEQDFIAENPRAIVHCYDHTVSTREIAIYSIEKLIKLVLSPSKYDLREPLKYFSYRRFFPKRASHFKERVWHTADENSVTVHGVFAKLSIGSRVFLKIDIEGSEYRIMDQLPDFFDRIDGMVIEFHDADINAERLEESIEVIRRAFYVVHVHGNNCGGTSATGFPNIIEVTFKHKRFFASEPVASTRVFPVAGLDFPNDPHRPDLRLWFDAK